MAWPSLPLASSTDVSGTRRCGLSTTGAWTAAPRPGRKLVMGRYSQRVVLSAVATIRR